MKQTELVSGFSELKDLLIRTYRMQEDRQGVKLYFSPIWDQTTDRIRFASGVTGPVSEPAFPAIWFF